MNDEQGKDVIHPVSCEGQETEERRSNTADYCVMEGAKNYFEKQKESL